ncbi:hypothetical protein M9Y10_044523 [Tritrichomonas musculus]|uniref:Protein kinase domain-containing protein n=1 Tax=Tritrichomonas musculus TaxID=1915356 RepID=A0ABR2JTW6_9EUKA
MLKQIDISHYTVVEKLSNENSDDFFFNLPHTTFLSRESQNDNRFVVIKEFPSIPSSQFSSLARNVESINMISHPCLANVIGFYKGNQKIPPSLIYTYYSLRSVKDLIKSFKSNNRNNKYQFFNGTHFMKICYGVAYAMNLMHLHNPPFVHRDLRAGTVLLTPNYEPCLSGFGISEVNSDNKYVAPEIISNKKQNAFLDPSSLPPIDVYAYGVLINKLLKIFIYSANIISQNDLQSLECFKSLIKKCKFNNPMGRPKSSDILLILDKNEFTNSLSNIKSCNFDSQNYAHYRNLLLSTSPGSYFQIKKKSDIDLAFGPTIQVNPFLNQEQPQEQASESTQSKREKKTYLTNDIQKDKIFESQSKPEIGQVSLSKTYSSQVASQVINSQPRTSRRSQKTQSFPDKVSYQAQNPNPNYHPQQVMQTPRTPIPQLQRQITQQQSYSFSNQTRQKQTFPYPNDLQNQPKLESINPYNLSDNFCIDSNLMLSSSEGNETDASSKETSDFSDFDNFLKNQNETNLNAHNQNNSNTSDYSDFDNLVKNQNETQKRNNSNNSTSIQFNRSTFPSVKTNENSKQPEFNGTRILGTSFLFGGKSNMSGRSVDEIYNDALHNDRGDTVYLNIIRATKLFKEAADRGHTDSMYMLAMKLYKGLGIRVDVGEAIRYFNKSWKEGRKRESLSQLAEIYITNKSYRNVEEADKCLKEALKANDLYANYLVVKLFVENDKYNYFYCSENVNKKNGRDIENAMREAETSLKFCLKNEYKTFSKAFIEFAKIAPKSFFDSLQNDAKSDPSAMFFLGILHHQAIIESSSASKAVSLLENSFLKNYRSAFDYFVDNNLTPLSSSSHEGCYNIINGSKIAKSGRQAEAISYLRSGSEKCTWAPDYEAIHAIVDAMKSGSVDTKPVIDLLTRYADNGSGPAREELGMLLIQGINNLKSVNKGLYYLKSAFDDENYEMRNYQYLHVNCPGFYFQPSSR